MSLDIVDDLQAAEDYIAVLQVEVYALAKRRHDRQAIVERQGFVKADGSHGYPFEACKDEQCQRYERLAQPWQRPTEDDES